MLKAVYRTSLREATACTLRVLEVILNLLELLIDMGILKQPSKEEMQSSPPEEAETPKKSDKEKMPTSATHTSFGGESFIHEQPMSPHKLVMSTIVRYIFRYIGNNEIYQVNIFRVLKHLGCLHGCADGQRGPAAEFLRTQCQNILTRLHKSSQKQFKKFLRDYVRIQPLNEILDVFHAYLGYCVDPTSLLSPLSKFIMMFNSITTSVWIFF